MYKSSLFQRAFVYQNYPMPCVTILSSNKKGVLNMKFRIFKVRNESWLSAIECEDDEKHVLIPDGVTGIEIAAFKGLENIESVVMPDSVTIIEAYAFQNCINLSEIKFSANLENINKHAFRNTKWLENQGDFAVVNDNVLYKYQGNEKEVVIPENIQRISEYAFAKNKNVESIIMSDNVLKIENQAFLLCKNLKYIRMSEKLSVIEEKLFRGCNSLEEISNTNNVNKIKHMAFAGCVKLEKINFPGIVDIEAIEANCGLEHTMWFENYDSDFVIIGDLLYKYKGNQSEIIVPENIRIIGNSSFSGCTSIKSIIIPESVKIIGESAFYGCTSLKNVEIFGKPKIMDDAFGKTGLEFDWVIQPEFEEFNLSYDEEKYEYTFSLISENKTVTRTFNIIMPKRDEDTTIYFDYKTGFYGAKNKIGDVIAEPEYSLILPFFDGYAVVLKNKGIGHSYSYGVIDIKGDVLLATEYKFIRPDFPDRVAAVKNGCKWGFINVIGKCKDYEYLVSPQFEEVSDYIQGHAAVKKDGKWGLIRVNLGKRY